MAKKYRFAKPYRGKTGDPNEEWFAYFYFINPSTGTYSRIKVKEGLNYIHDLDQKDKFLKSLIKEINTKLEAGYDPFEAEEITQQVIHEIKVEQLLEENPTSPLLTFAFSEFLENKIDKQLSDNSIAAYEGYISRFELYLKKHQMLDIRLDTIDTKFISKMLDWLKIEQKWGGSTFNNHLNFWIILLNWFSKKPRNWIKREDFVIGTDGEIELKNTKVMKNQYFGDTVAKKVRDKFKDYPTLEFYCKFIYFSCMRPDEIRHLKIENVDITGRYIKIVGKTKSRTVPICDELAEMLTSLKLSKFPLSYYVIGQKGTVSKNMHSENYYAEIFREKVRKPLGLSDEFTPYGWKHTRVVDLLNAGFNDAEVMNLTGHKDTASYDKYKRDLIGHLKTRLRGKTVGWGMSSKTDV